MTANIALPVLSGILTGLSFNHPNLSFLVWFSLVPLIYAIKKQNLKIIILKGIIFTFCYYAVAIFWLAKVSKLGLFFLLVYLSFYYILFLVFGQYFIKRPFRIVSLSFLWVILEYLKENVWCGFGWANLGYSQYRNFYLIQVADLGGTKLISFLIVMVNILIWEITGYLILRRNPRALARGAPQYKDSIGKKYIFRKVVFVLLIFLSCFIYSFFRLSHLVDSGSIGISVVQPNVSQELKWQQSSEALIAKRLESFGQQTKEADLIIFPEASWPLVVDKDNLDSLTEFIKNINRNVLLGAVVSKKNKFYNAALLFNKKGELLTSYYKMKLVPFGEYVPLRERLSFIKVINSIGEMSPGKELVRFVYKSRSFSVLICFEDIFPLPVLRFSRQNDFLINITNDAWFGGQPEASQHFAIMTLRAVENRISIVRSANTGISGWVSFKGNIEKLKNNKRDIFFPGQGSFDISLTNQRSFYNRSGEIFPFLGIIFLGMLIYKESEP